MSVDWTTVCDKCRVYHHLGQFMGGVPSFGYGYHDENGRMESANFVDEHMGCAYNDGEFLKIVKTDNIPVGYKKSEKVVEKD